MTRPICGVTHRYATCSGGCDVLPGQSDRAGAGSAHSSTADVDGDRSPVVAVRLAVDDDIAASRSQVAVNSNPANVPRSVISSGKPGACADSVTSATEGDVAAIAGDRGTAVYKNGAQTAAVRVGIQYDIQSTGGAAGIANMGVVADCYVVASLERYHLVTAAGFFDILRHSQIGCQQGDIARSGNAAGAPHRADCERAAAGEVQPAGAGCEGGDVVAAVGERIRSAAAQQGQAGRRERASAQLRH